MAIWIPTKNGKILNSDFIIKFELEPEVDFFNTGEYCDELMAVTSEIDELYERPYVRYPVDVEQLKKSSCTSSSMDLGVLIKWLEKNQK